MTSFLYTACESCMNPKLILWALQNIFVKLKSRLNCTWFLDSDASKHQHILLLIKHWLKKCQLEMSPNLFFIWAPPGHLGAAMSPACVGENGCSWKLKKWKEELAVMTVHTTWGCALSGERHLEVNGTRWSSVLRSNTDELNYWV